MTKFGLKWFLLFLLFLLLSYALLSRFRSSSSRQFAHGVARPGGPRGPSSSNPPTTGDACCYGGEHRDDEAPQSSLPSDAVRALWFFSSSAFVFLSFFLSCLLSFSLFFRSEKGSPWKERPQSTKSRMTWPARNSWFSNKFFSSSVFSGPCVVLLFKCVVLLF